MRHSRFFLLLVAGSSVLLTEPSTGQPIASGSAGRSLGKLTRLTDAQVRNLIVGMEVTTSPWRPYLVFEPGKFVIGGGHQPRYVLGTYRLSRGIIRYRLADETVGRRAYYQDGDGRFFEADDDGIKHEVVHPVSVRKLEPMPSVP